MSRRLRRDFNRLACCCERARACALLFLLRAANESGYWKGVFIYVLFLFARACVQAWKKRWFVLRSGRLSGDPNVLEYYRSQTSKKPKRSILLDQCIQVRFLLLLFLSLFLSLFTVYKQPIFKFPKFSRHPLCSVIFIKFYLFTKLELQKLRCFSWDLFC